MKLINGSFFILSLVVGQLSLAQNTRPPNTKTTSGRFQLIQLSEVRRDQFMIDTETGQVWNMTCASTTGDGECRPYLQKIEVEGKFTRSPKD